MKGYGAKAADIKKIDDHTVEIITPTPNPIFPRDWTFLYIMSKSWAEKNKTTEATNVKGGESNYANLHATGRSEEHTSELPSLMRISYAVLSLKKHIDSTNYPLPTQIT